MKICINTEKTKENIRIINNGNGTKNNQDMDQIYEIKNGGYSRTRQKNFSHKKTPATHIKKNQGQANRSPVCKKCSYQHEDKKCPAYGKKCTNCGKYNHFATMCKSKVRNNKNVNFIQNNENIESNSENFVFIGTIEKTINAINDEESWVAPMLVNNQTINFKLDSGAVANVIPVSYLDKINQKINIKKTGRPNLKSYTLHPLPIIGTCYLKCSYKNINKNLLFYVVNLNSVPILGLKACLEFNLIKRVDSIDVNVNENNENKNSNFIESLLNKYKFLFEGIGCLKKPYQIKLKDNAKPVIHATRKVPFALIEQFKLTLNELEKQNIIKKNK